MAIASLIFGLIGCVPILPQALAVGLGAGSLRRIRRRPEWVGGAGLAWAGLALGLIFGATWVAFLVGVVKHGSWAFTYATTAVPAVPPFATIPGKPPDTAEDFSGVDEAMERVGRALKVYRQDFKRLPAQLAELVPSYARRDELTYTDGQQEGQPFHYVDGLDPARDEPNAIVVYTDPLVPPPPDYYGYGGRYVQPGRPNLWEKDRAPRGICRMILTLRGDRSLLLLDEFDARLARQRGQSTRPAPGRRTHSTRPSRN